MVVGFIWEDGGNVNLMCLKAIKVRKHSYVFKWNRLKPFGFIYTPLITQYIRRLNIIVIRNLKVEKMIEYIGKWPIYFKRYLKFIYHGLLIYISMVFTQDVNIMC